MGFLSWLNRNAGELRDTSIVDRGFKDATGAAGDGRVVGIEQRLDDGTTKRYIAVAHGARVSGIEIAHAPAAVVARLHLGAEFRIRADGDKVLLDAPDVAQKLRRKPPAEGVTDKAVDWGDQRRLKKWSPQRATITALRRRESTLNFDVTLSIGAVAAGTEIPFYAAWLAVPGAEVPVVVDGDRAVVDWAAAANEPNRPAGGPDDPPPAGSAAAALTPY